MNLTSFSILFSENKKPNIAWKVWVGPMKMAAIAGNIRVQCSPNLSLLPHVTLSPSLNLAAQITQQIKIWLYYIFIFGGRSGFHSFIFFLSKDLFCQRYSVVIFGRKNNNE